MQCSRKIDGPTWIKQVTLYEYLQLYIEFKMSTKHSQKYIRILLPVETAILFEHASM
jgi:hypothetical protein